MYKQFYQHDLHSIELICMLVPHIPVEVLCYLGHASS